MQLRQNHQGRFFTIQAGKVPKTALMRQKRAEGFLGAAKRFYVK
jgi:hypothetical protein